MEDRDFILPLLICDSTYFRMLDFEVVEDFGHPLTNSIWLGEHAFAESGASDTSTYFARVISAMIHEHSECIGGVLRDFPGESAASPDGTSNLNVGVLVQGAQKMAWGGDLFVRTIGDHAEAEDAIKKQCQLWAKKGGYFFEELIFEGYVDDLNLKSLEPAKRTVRLLELFMLLSVLISLLGLIAMSTYYSGENTQGIAIRKAFGSDVQRELWRTVRGYMLLVGLAAIIASPIAIWLCGKYLERFAYRIDRYGWIIAVAVLLTLVMAFLSVLWQTLCAARINPANALKSN